MTNTRPIQFAKDGKYSITKGDYFIRVMTNQNDNPAPVFHSISITPCSDRQFPQKYNRVFDSIPISDRNYCWVDICIRWCNFRLFDDYFKKLTGRCFPNVDSYPWSSGPHGTHNIYYPIITSEDNWKDKFNSFFSIIHDYDSFDKQTVKAIYDYMNLSSPLLEETYQRKRALARGATMGLFAYREYHGLSSLTPEIAAKIGDYLGNEAPSVARTCETAASMGKAELEREDQKLGLKR